MFTGQTKELFEKWYEIWFIKKHKFISISDNVPMFYTLPFSMQQGVYLQFLREQGMWIAIDVAWENGLISGLFYQIIQDSHLIYDHERIICFDHDTALKSAITKAAELLNERRGK